MSEWTWILFTTALTLFSFYVGTQYGKLKGDKK